MKTTILPWRHDSELAFVRDCFYPHHRPTAFDPYAAVAVADTLPSHPSSSITPHPALGLRRVAIWTFRSPRSVPRAVSATAKLVDARLHDLPPSTTPRVSQEALKSIYAMAFARFVGAFVDRDVRAERGEGGDLSGVEGGSEDEGDGSVTRVRAGESSMYAHAVAVGMPAGFVDLRHRCVHGEVPALPVLRRATDQALEWLWTKWWKGNARGDPARFRLEVEEELAEGDGGLGELRVDV